jgi:hypothetical protein
MELHENSQAPEVAMLVGIDMDTYDAEVSIDELEELARTAGAVVCAKTLQKRDRPDSATYVGSGKLEEIKEFAEANDEYPFEGLGNFKKIHEESYEEFFPPDESTLSAPAEITSSSAAIMLQARSIALWKVTDIP